MSEDRKQTGFRGAMQKLLIWVGGVTLLLLILLTVTMLAFGRERVPSRVILELDLERGLVEYVPDDPLLMLLRRDAMSVRDVVDALDRAAEDRRVVGLVTRIGSGELGLAQIEELRNAVGRFRESGKPAWLFSETFGEFASGRGGYYLATSFDEIHLQPSGDVGLAGFASEVPFLAGTLERIGVQPQMDRRYEYKDGLNLLTEQSMTAPQREAIERVVRSLYEQLVAGIAAGRGLDSETVQTLIDRGPFYGSEAVEARLVDRLSYRDEAYEGLRERVGGGEFLLAEQYLRRAGRPNTRGSTVALIYGTGTIMRGESEASPLVGGATMGSETVARAFRDAIADDEVEAIIFRVDSPGGSYVASDVIWRETVRARSAGKPVVVTMGNTAGSGGYFVAMGADRIVAQPSTVTGSIGVYGGKLVVSDLSERLGVTWDRVTVGGNTTMWSFIEPYSPTEWARVQVGLDRIYEDFVSKVADGRDLSRDSAHAVARGRIWSGADAHRLGLVDELGGFDVALRSARDLIGVEPDAPIRLRSFPRRRTLVESLLRPRRSSSESIALDAAARLLVIAEPLIHTMERLGALGPTGVLTMPPIRFAP